jgi:hypothetical protein
VLLALLVRILLSLDLLVQQAHKAIKAIMDPLAHKVCKVSKVMQVTLVLLDHKDCKVK